MTALERSAIASHLAVIVLCLTVAACAVAATRSLTGSLRGLNQAMATVNRPCAPGPCGTLAQLTKTVTRSGDAMVTTQIQEQNVSRQVVKTLAQLGEIAPHAAQTLDTLSSTASGASAALATATQHLTPVLDAAASTTQRAGGLIDDIDRQTGPLFTKADGTLDAAYALETSADTRAMLSGLATTSTNLGGITTDFRTRFHLILFPPPCKTLGCRMARAYPYVKSAAELGEASYWTRELLTGGQP